MNESKILIVEAFIKKLGDVSQWSYTGEVVDHGRGSTQKCVCGHPIRYGYCIQNGKKIVEIGSECINHFEGYNTALFESLKKAIEDKKLKEKELKKQAKLDAESEVLGPIIAEYVSLKADLTARYKAQYGNRFCPNYDLWSLVAREMKSTAPYKTLKKKIEWYSYMIKAIKQY
jgi:hypothetical protein